jgi:hypothetical protein
MSGRLRLVRRRLLPALSAGPKALEVAMRNMARFVIASAIVVVAIPAAAYYLHAPSNDPLGDKLRRYGFFPVEPPSTLMEVGGLYYVSADARKFTPICQAEKTDLDTAVSESRSVKIEEDLAQDGGLTTEISLKLGSLVGGSGDNSYVQKVHFSLTDVKLQEIALGSDSLIYAKLMARPECNSVAARLVVTDGYVCQGQRILRATAEYKFDRDSLMKLGGHVDTASGQANDAEPIAVDTESNQRLVERQGRMLSGSALDYGVVFTPTCLAPEHARFARVLPTTRLGRAINYLLYHVVEPLLPPTNDEVDVAQNGLGAAK